MGETEGDARKKKEGVQERGEEREGREGRGMVLEKRVQCRRIVVARGGGSGGGRYGMAFYFYLFILCIEIMRCIYLFCI